MKLLKSKASPWHDLTARLIMLQDQTESCACYLMTSCGVREGVPMICDEVAAIAAAAGKKVAVLKIGTAEEPGAVSLARIKTPIDCAPHVEVDYVRLSLPASFDALPPFAPLPKDWMTGIELLLIDAPAIGDFMQQHLAPLCDGVVLVADTRKRRLAQVVRAADTISRQGGKLIGAVLNRHQSPIPRWLDKWGDCPPSGLCVEPRPSATKKKWRFGL